MKTMRVRVEQPPNKVYDACSIDILHDVGIGNAHVMLYYIRAVKSFDLCLQKVPIDTLCLQIMFDCIIQEEEGCQDRYRAGAKELCCSCRSITDVNHESPR